MAICAICKRQISQRYWWIDHSHDSETTLTPSSTKLMARSQYHCMCTPSDLVKVFHMNAKWERQPQKWLTLINVMLFSLSLSLSLTDLLHISVARPANNAAGRLWAKAQYYKRCSGTGTARKRSKNSLLSMPVAKRSRVEVRKEPSMAQTKPGPQRRGLRL